MTENSRTRLPEVLLDAATFGVRFEISPCDQATMALIRSRLTQNGLLTRGTDDHRLRLEVPIGDDAESGVASVELVPSHRHPGLFLNMSSIQINGMRLLRKAGYGDESPGLSLDGSDNFIGVTALSSAELFPVQLDRIVDALIAVFQALENVIPDACEVKEFELWLRAAEVCSDLDVPNAKAVPRWLQRAGLAGTVRGCSDLYRGSANERDGHVVVRYWRQAKGPCAKVYAKGEDLLRVEIACTDRTAIRVLGCKATAEYVTDETLKGLLIEFARLSAPLLRDISLHAREAIESTTSVADLLLALSPLLDFRSGANRRTGRPPKAPARAMAAEAIDALFASGKYDAMDCRTGHALRRVLDELSTPSGPLVRSGKRAIFCLSPRFARAANSVAMQV